TNGERRWVLPRKRQRLRTTRRFRQDATLPSAIWWWTWESKRAAIKASRYSRPRSISVGKFLTNEPHGKIKKAKNAKAHVQSELPILFPCQRRPNFVHSCRIGAASCSLPMN